LESAPIERRQPRLSFLAAEAKSWMAGARSSRGELLVSTTLCHWIASRRLSSGAHSRDPLAGNDGDVAKNLSRVPDAAQRNVAPQSRGLRRWPRISSAPRRFRGASRSVRGTPAWTFEVMSALACDVG